MSLKYFLGILFGISCQFGSFVLVSGGTNNLIVKLKNNNELKGVEQHSAYNKKEYVEFRGIPYANPPIGDLRFKSPVKFNGVWSKDGPRDATTFGSMCPQLNSMDMESDDSVLGDEDCLFLNVATPNPHSKEKYPVAIWIHGGSFQFESGDAYGPEKFMEHPIILVTFNYRLSVFGFLNSEDGQIQGNMGLKDQVLLLQWIKENIESFGGDPNNVTIFGTNTGAVSVHLHMLSDMSKGLFHRAISQSGTAIAPWVVTRSPARRLQKLVKLLECKNETSSYECIMQADVTKIIINTQGFAEWYIDPLVPTGPTLELLGSEPKFLTRNPYSIIKSGDYHGKNIPWIVGVNSHEGLLHSVDIVTHGILNRVFNWEWSKAAPITLLYRFTAIDANSVSDNVWKFYFEKDEGETSLEVDDEKTGDDEEKKDEAKEQSSDEPEEDRSKDENENTTEEVQKDEANEEVKSDTTETDEGSGEDSDEKPPKLDDSIFNGPRPNKKSDLMVGKDNRMEEITNMYSDRYFFHPLHHTARLHVLFGGENQAPLYLYYFEYKGNQTIVQWSGHTDRYYGVAHFDQIQYMFTTPYFNETQEVDTEFGKDYVKGLVNFIKDGSPPSPQWRPITNEMAHGETPLIYNRITSKETDSEELLEEPFTERVQFWDKQLILEMEKENMVDMMTAEDAVNPTENNPEMNVKGKDEL